VPDSRLWRNSSSANWVLSDRRKRISVSELNSFAPTNKTVITFYFSIEWRLLNSLVDPPGYYVLVMGVIFTLKNKKKILKHTIILKCNVQGWQILKKCKLVRILVVMKVHLSVHSLIRSCTCIRVSIFRYFS